MIIFFELSGIVLAGSLRRSEPAEASVDAGEGIVAGLSADLDGYIVTAKVFRSKIKPKMVGGGLSYIV